MTDPASTALAAPRLSLGDHADVFQAAVERARVEDWATRLFAGDVTLWTTDLRVGEAIAERLGWLEAPAHFADRTAGLEAFGDAVVEEGYNTAVVAGMGGSSLAPDVLHRTFGSIEGYLALRILDSTDPAYVAATLDDLDPLRTLVIVATKSGTTTEPNAFQAYAWDRAVRALKAVPHSRYEHPGAYFAAITDPDSARHIEHNGDFREIFLNPPEIGGRYSALTYVGLVPASLIGIDLDALLASAAAMLGACREPDAGVNPGLSLGLAIGTLAKAGRDKLTFLADDEIGSFGAWAEQLIAESTGKHGVGIVPVDGEPLGAVGAYGTDRAFVRLTLAGADGGGRDALADALEGAGHPVIRIEISDPIDIGAEFVRWEVAVAIAGAVLGIDPFDQPNVEEAKQLTRDLLERHGREGGQDRRAPAEAIGAGDGLTLYGDAALRLTAGASDVTGELARHLARRRPDAYLCIQAFIAPTPARDEAFARIRTLLRDQTGRATTAGYGPRFLHSTGQLHKGGAPIGWFLQLTADHPADLDIPGWPYTFGQLIDAQAAGDFAAIESHDLPIVRIHLGADPDAGLAALERALAAALAMPTEA
jgi:glucose-6-phosphate isomerase